MREEDRTWEESWQETGLGHVSQSYQSIKHYDYFHCSGSENYVLDDNGDPSGQMSYWKRRNLLGVRKEHAVGIREMYIGGLKRYIRGRAAGFTLENYEPLCIPPYLIEEEEERSEIESKKVQKPENLLLVNGYSRDGIDFVQTVLVENQEQMHELMDVLIEVGVAQNLSVRVDPLQGEVGYEDQKSMNFVREHTLIVKSEFLQAIMLDDQEGCVEGEVQWNDLMIQICYSQGLLQSSEPYRVMVLQYHGDPRLMIKYPHRIFEEGFDRTDISGVSRSQQLNVLHDQMWCIQPTMSDTLSRLVIFPDLKRIVRGKNGKLGRLYLLIGSLIDRNQTRIGISVQAKVEIVNRIQEFEEKRCVRPYLNRTRVRYPEEILFDNVSQVIKIENVPEKAISLLLSYKANGIASRHWASLRFVVFQGYGSNKEEQLNIRAYLDGEDVEEELFDYGIMLDLIITLGTYKVNGSALGVELPLIRKKELESELFFYLVGAGSYPWQSQFEYVYSWILCDDG